MTPLDEIIRREIDANGPLRLDRFWNMALFDPVHGYYNRREPFGREGDFITAPDVSQMFGELIGAWLVTAWREMGRPSPFVLAEMGPGRGTLMADILRTIRSLDRDAMAAAQVRLVETSDRLAALQLERLSAFDLPIARVRRLEDLPALPLLLVANELLDAVAIRQLRFIEGAWRERAVTTTADGNLAFIDDDPVPEASSSLAPLGPPFEGAVFEFSPARDAIVATLGGRLARSGGAALLIDYGHLHPGYGDTLQALRDHRFASVLESVGEADITSHVDFARVMAMARKASAAFAAAATQGQFLLSLGLLERAGILGRHSGPAERDQLTAAVRRLAGTTPGEMGELFKVAAISSQRLALPPFVFAANQTGPVD